MNVLIVDDNATNLRVLRATLMSEGFRVVEASDGAQGLEKIGREKIDAIVSDILMPNMDGYRFCRAVRGNAASRDIPFVMYTSTALSSCDEKLSIDVGADRYLRKPTSAAILGETLRMLIENKEKKEPSTVQHPDEDVLLTEYNQVLVKKLEEKNIELARQNCRMAEQQMKFQELVENVKEVLFITSKKGDSMIYVSPAYETIWGVSCESLYANPSSWMDLIHPDDRGRIEEEIRGISVSEQRLEYRIVRSDGTVRWIKARTVPVQEHGDSDHVVGVAEDVTRLREADEENGRLQGQFLQSQKMEAVGHLAGGIAHDFNNLLSVILGYSDFVLKGIADGKTGEAVMKDVEEIKNAAVRAAALTRQLLAFSRRQVLQPVIMNLNDSIGGLEKMLRRVIGENIALVSTLDPAAGPVKADPGQIEQVIMNLVVNARDAMPKGGCLSIRTQNVSLRESFFVRENVDGRPGPYVKISVSDNGVGMDSQTKVRAFEPFFTTKEKGKGTGLGLSTVFGIVKQSEGHVVLESEPGKGATFHIYLPRVEGNVVAHAPEPGGVPLTDGKAAVLVVEDDHLIRSMVCRILKSMSYHVLEASSGEEGEAVCQNRAGTIDLLITDIVMPGMNGIDFAEKAVVAHPEMKVLFMSGYSDHPLFRADVIAQKRNFLQKPFLFGALTTKIREILTQPEQEAA